MNTFSFRAETPHDVNLLSALMARHGIYRKQIMAPHFGLPDVKVELETDLQLETLRNLMRAIPDSHVMIQSLRECPLKENSLIRDTSKGLSYAL